MSKRNSLRRNARCSNKRRASRVRRTRRSRSLLASVKIRRARPTDKAPVLHFCRRTWGDYGDFIDRVWDEWLRDKRGFFAVAALGERPIGTAKLTLLKPGEVWFEGLRVDREFRGIGLAHVLTSFLLKKASRMGAKSVRYATGGSNLTSQHIGRSWGFELLRRYTCLEAPPDGRRKPVLARVTDPARALQLLNAAAAGLSWPGGASAGNGGAVDEAAGSRSERKHVRRSRQQAIAQLTRVLRSSRFVTSMKGLASEGWTFYQIDKDFVERALRRREFYVALLNSTGSAGKSGVAGQSGTASAPAVAGLIVAAAQRRRQRLLVWTLADLREDCLSSLLGGTRRLAFDFGLKEVRLVAPYARAMTVPARKVGFRQEYEGLSAVVMEQVRGQGPRGSRTRRRKPGTTK